MKKIFLYDCCILAVMLVPSIPLSIKGILGLLFIVFSSIRTGLKNSMGMAIVLVAMQVVYFLLSINVDYKNGVTTMMLGSLLYLTSALILGKNTDLLKNKNQQLEKEVERRMKTEESLNEKIRLLQSLMDTLPTPVFVKDLDLNFLSCNRAYERDFGILEKEIVGKKLYDVFHTKLSETQHSMDLDFLHSSSSQIVYESIDQYADGTLRHSIHIKTLLTDEKGKPTGIVGVITDITDKKQSEQLKESLEKDKNMLLEILEYDRIKTQFFSNISHELRTPLNVILGAVQLLEMYSQQGQYAISQGKLIKNVYSIKQNCFRLLRLLNNLIDITKIDAKAFEIYLKNRNIVSIVEEVTLSIIDYANNKGITLEFDTEVEEKIIACDEEKIERIMLNLLSNAIKFTHDGGNIFVNVYDRGHEVCIAVSDTGIGIPFDRQDEIFKRFNQINPIFTKFQEGSGIGLSLVKDLVKMHSGEITVESEPGKGSTFYVTLPNRLVTDENENQDTLDRQVGVEGIQLEFSDIYSEFRKPYIVAI